MKAGFKDSIHKHQARFAVLRIVKTEMLSRTGYDNVPINSFQAAPLWPSRPPGPAGSATQSLAGCLPLAP